jgi:hypothetical protein
MSQEHGMHLFPCQCIGFFFPPGQISAGPTLFWIFIRLAEGYHGYPLSSSWHRLLNLSATLAQRRAERWAGAYLSKRKEGPVYVSAHIRLELQDGFSFVRYWRVIRISSHIWILDKNRTARAVTLREDLHEFLHSYRPLFAIYLPEWRLF